METFKAPFKGRSLLNWIEWTPEEIETLLNLAIQVKAESHRGEIHQRFLGKTIALIFEKRSTRTRSSFETAFGEEGGHPVFMSTDDIQLGGKESVQDTARVLGRMFSAIEFRGFKQEHVEQLAKYSGIPVINGLTDEFHPIPSYRPSQETRMGTDGMEVRERYRDILQENIDYDVLIQNPQIDQEQLDEIVEILVDTVCTSRKTIRIASDDFPAEVVRSRFLKLTGSHIQYVLACMKENTTRIRNIKKYLLAALYNASVTMGSYYSALVQHDLAEGG